jgi:hypothetical protein
LAGHAWPLWIQRHYILPEYAGFRTWLYLILTAIFFPLIVGGIIKMRLRPYQVKLDILKFGGEENRPRIISVRHDEDSRTVVKIRAVGIGVEKFKGRKGDLQAAFNQTVESVLAEENAPQYIEITLSSISAAKTFTF